MKFIYFLVSIFLIACDDDEKLPFIPLDEINDIADTITIDNQRLYLTTELYRDFMPVSPPDGNSLVAVAYITNVSFEAISSNISADAIWVVYENKEWRSSFTNEEVNTEPYRLGRIAKGGPKWGPEVYVTTIVRLSDGKGGTVFLRASNQWIVRLG